jgi:hypothetical protein
MTLPSANFYSDLPVHRVTLSELLGDEARFVQVPADWNVVITDIRNSTIAHGAGRHEAITLIATGSIIATLNLARKKNVAVPFFFGGDGATMLVPPTADQRRQLDEHIHFVDAADGGYTMAARMWRKKQR